MCLQIINLKYMYLALDNMQWLICHEKVKLTTFVEDDTKAPFSIATTPRCWRGRYSIPWVSKNSIKGLNNKIAV